MTREELYELKHKRAQLVASMAGPRSPPYFLTTPAFGWAGTATKDTS